MRLYCHTYAWPTFLGSTRLTSKWTLVSCLELTMCSIAYLSVYSGPRPSRKRTPASAAFEMSTLKAESLPSRIRTHESPQTRSPPQRMTRLRMTNAINSQGASTRARRGRRREGSCLPSQVGICGHINIVDVFMSLGPRSCF